MKIEEKKKALLERINSKSKDLQAKADGFKSLGKDALLVGGILVIAYSLYNVFADEEEEDIKEKAPIESKAINSSSIITKSITGVATSFLLALAKDKLMDYLDNLKSDDNEDNPETK